MIRTDELLLNVGPQHPSTHGVFRLIVKIDGETIIEATPVIGYLHRGTEKLAEDLMYTQIIPYTDRMDYVSAMLGNYAYVHAVETLMEIEVPERAEYLRVIAMELNRIASHLVWFGTYLLDLGAITPFLYAFREREKILQLLAELSGSRMTYSYMRIGGVKWDVPDEGWLGRLDAFLDAFSGALEEFHDLVTGNEIIQARLKGVGKYDAATAIAYGLTGVNLRSTGVNYDVRRAKPYSIYNRFAFHVPTREEGDLWARYCLRMEEMEQSRRIVKQAVAQFPSGGDIVAKLPKVLRAPAGEVYTSVESTRGELGVYIRSEGGPKPYRVHFRRPSFVNLQILPRLLVGEHIANMVAIIGGIDVIMGEVDA
ncbi:NADH-quinone oxidoreductase subunit D [Kyrpidia tusciae]|uniref:NADH-quinone oxidoreductase subunit D n=1 Tax=Kyrpidia tusciae (strain DSM 2912 / NBRC 15312 / T2) TaxID=562970 RepID=D5WV46_KYRT2|nr:NADH-quinone oxidoreductase subunit D [Kyrpidia tusciae]ADG07518.1 NADH dehydrogenase I, D subunit [Kyrpidia tusciae DSM 2912]MBE3552465.1 NADH-quinone oxidoreductase subunit D [Kyrpidia tusciae]